MKKKIIGGLLAICLLCVGVYFAVYYLDLDWKGIFNSLSGGDSSSSENSSMEEENMVTELEYILSDDETYYILVRAVTIADTDTEIVIPATYEGLPVKEIASNAFEGYSDLTNIVIPNSIFYIRDNAFLGCDSLRYNVYDNGLYLGNTNNPYFAFIKGKEETIDSLVIHERTQIIADGALEGNGNVTSVTIGNSVVNIGYYAFSGCSGLTSVDIPNSVKELGCEAFSNCVGLTQVTLGNQIEVLIEGVFSGCSSLTRIEIPDSVTRIEAWVFFNCGNLTNVTFGKGLIELGGKAFANCNSLTGELILPDNVMSRNS